MHLGIFEDVDYVNFLPLTYTRPVCELIVGMKSIRERIADSFQHEKRFIFTRSYLAPTIKGRVKDFYVNIPEGVDDDILLINGRLVADPRALRIVEGRVKLNTIGLKDGDVALAYLKAEAFHDFGELLTKPVNSKDIVEALKGKVEAINLADLRLLRYPWEIIDINAEMIREDFEAYKGRPSEGEVDDRAAIYGDRRMVFIGKGSFIEAYTTLDAREGPIFIGNNSYIQTLTRITGPTYIGDNTIIFGAQIREGCSIGNVCRVGGEVEETVIQSFSNKRHVGFIGHSYIGEWVNMGAGTENSDLKNTYGEVKVTIGGRKINTGRIFIGCFIGDHVKTSIGAHIFTGKKIGLCSSIIGFITDDVPSFTIWAKSLGAPPTELLLESAIETQRRMFARRKVQQTKEDRELLRKLFEITEEERKHAGVVKQRFEM